MYRNSQSHHQNCSDNQHVGRGARPRTNSPWNAVVPGRGRGRGPGRGYFRGRGRGAQGPASLAYTSVKSDGTRGSAGVTGGQRVLPSVVHGFPSYLQNGRVQGQRKFLKAHSKLEQLLREPADFVVFELLNKKFGLLQLLKEEGIGDEILTLVIEVLAHATSSHSSRAGLSDLFVQIFDPHFINKLGSFTCSIQRKFPERAEKCFTSLFTVFEVYATVVTAVAVDRLPAVLDLSITALDKLTVEGHCKENLVKQYEALQLKMTEETKKYEQQGNDKRRPNGFDRTDQMEPPDDFCLIPVVPTPYDLSMHEKPFLRRNIVQGRYSDSRHYLDVQFRLMREDFVRPLRNGIHDFKSNSRAVIRDIKIYRNVTIIGLNLHGQKLIHDVQLSLPKNFSLQNSKRLLYGNLLCFSSDNFNTFMLGSVEDRNEMQKKSIIGVSFETGFEAFDLSAKFVVAESRSYFMAYKHVLTALQNMADEPLPLEPYIVHIQENLQQPPYVHDGETYDLRVVKSSTMMRTDEAESFLHRNRRVVLHDNTDEDEVLLHLEEIEIQRDLHHWPPGAELGLDGSQCRALRSALTRQLAIIQGPPGTGKTFLGLKIVQVLLHNSDIWKPKDNPTPILVVCFTNHALDQFLEGMTTYTQNILRIGSRSKSKIIEKFQVNNQLYNARNQYMIPDSLHSMGSFLRSEVSDIELKLKRLMYIRKECEVHKGIVSLEFLENENVIPKLFQSQIKRCGKSKALTYWLISAYQPQQHAWQYKTLQPSEAATQQARDGKNDDTKDQQWEHGQELLKLEERDRLLADDYNDAEAYKKMSFLDYETSNKVLKEEIYQAAEKLRVDEYNVEAHLRHNICQNTKEAIRYGLYLLPEDPSVAQLENQEGLDVWHLDFGVRWQLYRHWIKKAKEKADWKFYILSKSFQKRKQALDEVKSQQILFIMRQTSVVGMTTTGAAQHNSLLQDLGPAIVVVEEAAEILESHVVTSLSSKCQHLIMIGDHQQLRPSATVYELATKYGLDTSLFERMIKNGLAFETLEYQHRMRPSISKLLVPSVYPTLKDHPSVHTHPTIRGLTKDLFFISHQIHEKKDSDDNSSHENSHEAELMMGLCSHLLLQGYSPDHITILTPYSGQFFLLRKIQCQHSECSDVKICVVDNFQGEENDIILLSLVRSNAEGQVGFLRTDNRVCVALSRAKHGLYITGNMNLLSASSNLWKGIEADLRQTDSIGPCLTLRCENHPHQLLGVSSGQDFVVKSPNGGCSLICGQPLPECSHSCPKVCHLDDLEHTEYLCEVPCPKMLCSLGHRCPKRCGDECGPCRVSVSKTSPCGHTHAMQCHVAPENYSCPTKVQKIIPLCKHVVEMQCCDDPEKFACPVECDAQLDCGHKCRQCCHKSDDPDHEMYDCEEQCTRLNAACSQNHRCLKKCYEICGACVELVDKVLPCHHKAMGVECSAAVEDIKCKEKCKRTLPCLHPCKKMCDDDCGTCMTLVKKLVPECNHTITITCGSAATRAKCLGQCVKLLPCGHPCTLLCKDPCSDCQCVQLVSTANTCPQQHIIKLPCHLNTQAMGEDAWSYCEEPCNTILECGHICSGDCSSCLQGRLHIPCLKKCEKQRICGHVCKSLCSAECPPCPEPCKCRCSHGRCPNTCGRPCTPCEEKCTWQCKHHKCSSKFCGNVCSRKPCTEPCKKKLACGHGCVGFCGDVCPPLCRHCDKEQLHEFTEEQDDARFVYLEDCGHTIEVGALENWLKQETIQVGMKTCPRCHDPIYYNQRYSNMIMATYNTVREEQNKYYKRCRNFQMKKTLEIILQDPKIAIHFTPQSMKLGSLIGTGPNTHKKAPYFRASEWNLFHFQCVVLQKASEVLTSPGKDDENETSVHWYDCSNMDWYNTMKSEAKYEARLSPVVMRVVETVMRMKTVTPQLAHEVSSELQRLMILPAYWQFQEKVAEMCTDGLLVRCLKALKAKIEPLMDPTVKFGEDCEKKVIGFLKLSEKIVGGLDICMSERNIQKTFQ